MPWVSCVELLALLNIVVLSLSKIQSAENRKDVISANNWLVIETRRKENYGASKHGLYLFVQS